MSITTVVLFGANQDRFRPMTAILVFSVPLEKAMYKSFLMTQNLNLMLSDYVILCRRHFYNKAISYLVQIKWDFGQDSDLFSDILKAK